MMKRRLLSVGWRLPGERAVNGPISAREAKAVGATIFVSGAATKFEIYHKDNWGDERFPWRLSRVIGVGSERPGEMSVAVDEFGSLREAMREARKLAR